MKTIETLDPKAFRGLITTIGELPSSFVDSMSYYEMIAWLVDYIKNNVIPAVNNNAEAIKEIQKWIETLDLQDYVDTKLDEMAESGELAEIVASYLQANVTWTFDSVADMQSATNLIVGSYAKTLGYYEINDQGGATYFITDSGTADGGNVIAVGDLFAHLVIEDNTVNVRQFGCKGDNTTDDTTKFQLALDSNADVIYVPEGEYLITSTLVLPLNKTLRGCNANTCVLSVSDFNNYALQYGTSYVYGSKRGKIEDIRIATNATNYAPHTFGIYLNSGCEIRNVYLYHLKQGISKPDNYIDNIVIYRCHIMYCGGRADHYVVELKGNGDSILISQSQFGTAYDSESYSDYLGILIQGSTGLLIENNVINAPITLRNLKGSMINNHMEGPSVEEHFNLANIKIENSNVLVDTLYIHRCLNKPEFVIGETTTNEAHNTIVTLKNITISLTSLMYSNYQNLSDDYNIYIGDQIVLNLENVVNQLDYSAGWSATFPDSGVIIYDKNGAFSAFNEYSSIASIKSTISQYKVYFDQLKPSATGNTNSSLANTVANKYTPWFESGFNNTTVYYRRVSCWDWTRKLATSISNEKSLAGITSYASPSSIGKGSAIANTSSYLNATVGCGITDIIYRGTATGSYDKITKVPVVCSRAIYDFGTHIVGHPTESRTAGAIDDFDITHEYRKIGDNVEFTMSATPTYGTFTKGDRCINTTITAGGVKSWIYNGSAWIVEANYPS